MAEGDDPRDPSTAAGMPPPWPVVDKRSTYQHPPAQDAPSAPPSYRAPEPPRRTGGAWRWVVVALVAVVLVGLILWLLLG